MQSHNTTMTQCHALCETPCQMLKRVLGFFRFPTGFTVSIQGPKRDIPCARLPCSTRALVHKSHSVVVLMLSSNNTEPSKDTLTLVCICLCLLQLAKVTSFVTQCDVTIHECVSQTQLLDLLWDLSHKRGNSCVLHLLMCLVTRLLNPVRDFSHPCSDFCTLHLFLHCHTQTHSRLQKVCY